MIAPRRIPPDHPHALALVRAMEAEISPRYGPMDSERTSTARPDELAAYVAIYDGEAPVAGGGVKPLGDGICEIKRMYVAPARRGQGLGRRLLEALEDAARDLGFHTVRLDTGVEQTAALALYRDAGFREIPDYNGNQYASYWGEKPLRDP